MNSDSGDAGLRKLQADQRAEIFSPAGDNGVLSLQIVICHNVSLRKL